MAHPKPFLGINCMGKKLKYNLAKLLERKKLSDPFARNNQMNAKQRRNIWMLPVHYDNIKA